MHEVNTYDDFKKAASIWKPSLTKVLTIEEAADNINFPHEDYPDFVDNTLSAIEECIIILSERDITENDIKWIHKICMDGKEYINLGCWRKIEVIVSGELKPPSPYLVPQFMMSILPLNVDLSEEDIIKWYKEFETIHPFEDGNGRVGGIILAAISFINWGEYIVPKKEYKYTLDPIVKRITNPNDSFLNNANYFDLETSYIDRCFVYLESKIKNPKLDKCLDDLKIKKEIIGLIKNKKLGKIVSILNDI